MAVGSGIGATVGLAAEGDYGVYAAATRHLEFISDTLEETAEPYESEPLRGGGLFPRANRSPIVQRGGGGGLVTEFGTRGMGLDLSHMVGSTPAVTQLGGTAAYRQIHVPGANGHYGKSLSIQKGVPQTDGTVVPFTFKGCKYVGWTLSVDPYGALMLTREIDAREVSPDEAYVPASYVANAQVLHYAQGALKLGGTPSTSGGVVSISGGTAIDVVSVSLTGSSPMKTDRPKLGSLYKQQPINNGILNYGGTVTTEFIDQATIYDLWRGDTSTALQLTFVGEQIATGHNATLDIVIPNIKFRGKVPTVGGPDVVELEAPFRAYSDNVNAEIQFAYTSLDTAA